jgi:PadR family transcriptional regulator, regulatory protein PadR
MMNRRIQELLIGLAGGEGARAGLPSLSSKEALILKLLVEEGAMYGLKLVASSGGKLKRGTVYVTLGRMEDKGYVESRQEEQAPDAVGLPRRLYTPTARGITVLRAWEQAALALLEGEAAS